MNVRGILGSYFKSSGSPPCYELRINVRCTRLSGLYGAVVATPLHKTFWSGCSFCVQEFSWCTFSSFWFLHRHFSWLWHSLPHKLHLRGGCLGVSPVSLLFLGDREHVCEVDKGAVESVSVRSVAAAVAPVAASVYTR